MIMGPFAGETQKRAFSKRKCVIAGFEFKQFLYLISEKSNKLLWIVRQGLAEVASKGAGRQSRRKHAWM